MQHAIRIQPCGADVELTEGSFSRMSITAASKMVDARLPLFLVVSFLKIHLYLQITSYLKLLYANIFCFTASVP